MINTNPDVVPKGRYTIKEAAHKLDVSVTTVYRYIRSGILRSGVRCNGQTIILGSEITRFWGGEYC